MSNVIWRVAQGEGFRSVFRRGLERIGESVNEGALLLRGARRPPVRPAPPVLNVLAMAASPRLGGVPSQLLARLKLERQLRTVALLEARARLALLRISHPLHARAVIGFTPSAALFDESFERSIRAALGVAGTSAVHFEGMAGIPLGSVVRLCDAGIQVVFTAHDFSLFCARPHLFELPIERFCDYSRDAARCARCLTTSAMPPDQQEERRRLAAELLGRCVAVFPSNFMRSQHQRLFTDARFEGHVIQPGVPANSAIPTRPEKERRRARIAFVGAVKPHKGAGVFLEIVRGSGSGDAEWWLFGGGDVDLLRAFRSTPNVTVHGYYRSGALPALLVRHGIDLVVLPSIWPESHCLTLSESWMAGVPVIAFDHGALGERIREGGGWIVPLEEGAAGFVRTIRRWLRREISTTVRREVPTASDSANAHIQIYRNLRP